MTATVTETSSSRTTPVVALRVFGIGAAGVNILETLLHSAGETAAFVAVDTDADALAASSSPTQVHLEAKRARGGGTGGDPERGRAAAEENLARLTDQCRSAEVVLLIAGMGGGAGTGISPVLARAAREGGALVLACAVMPFECEGNLRQRQAQAGVERLRAAADGVICLPNQKIAGLIDENTGLLDTFKAANDLLVQGLRGLLSLLTQRGTISIHLDQLCALLRGRHAESVLATAEAHGPSRALDVVEKVLAHPLLDGGRALALAETVVVNLSGGPDLSLADVKRVTEQINAHCEGAQLLTGARVNDAWRERLAVTLIATRREEHPAKALERGTTEVASTGEASHSTANAEFLEMTSPTRNRTRLVPPAPTLPPEQIEQRFARQSGPGRASKATSRLRQGTLPLEVVSRGRFDKTEPNIHRGEDLDTPTYLRRGLMLN
jgi:cell division protein FtsZ